MHRELPHTHSLPDEALLHIQVAATRHQPAVLLQLAANRLQREVHRLDFAHLAIGDVGDEIDKIVQPVTDDGHMRYPMRLTSTRKNAS